MSIKTNSLKDISRRAVDVVRKGSREGGSIMRQQQRGLRVGEPGGVALPHALESADRKHQGHDQVRSILMLI